MIVVVFLIYGMVRVFRWAGMDLANRRFAQDANLTVNPTIADHGDPEVQLNSDLDLILPIAAVYHGHITNGTGNESS